LPDVEGLKIGVCIGDGHFSHVYEGDYNGIPVAVKVLERGSAELQSNEIDILTRLRGVDHIVQLLEVVRADHILLIFERLHSIDIETLLDRISLHLFRVYLRCVLRALEGAHARGIVHRDVKPGNVMVSPDWRTIKLIDWGCGAFVSNNMDLRAGSKICRPPEMMLGYQQYGTPSDIWAVGALILYFICDGTVPWGGRTNADALGRLSRFHPPGSIEALARRLAIPVPAACRLLRDGEDVADIESEFSEDFADLCHPDLIALAKLLLTIDPEKRPTATVALQHKFFR
jgi:serine/threonine protein kinase